MVTHLKKTVIWVCFLTLDTLVEAWASRRCCRSSISTSDTHIHNIWQNPLALLGVPTKSVPWGMQFGGGGGVSMNNSNAPLATETPDHTFQSFKGKFQPTAYA